MKPFDIRLLQAVEQNSVVIVQGATGCGCLDAAYACPLFSLTSFFLFKKNMGLTKPPLGNMFLLFFSLDFLSKS